MGLFCPLVQPWNRARDQFLLNLPCLSDRVRRSSLLLKLALVALHLVFIGVLFLFNSEFIEKTKRDPWYMASYFLLFTVTLLQYFITSGSSPGYVVDAMRDVCETNVLHKTPSTTSIIHASRKSENLVVTVDGDSASGARSTSTAWGKLVQGLYPPGTSIRNLTCGYCHLEQPPRAKHCHDCDRCVLQFDHHCVWLGTCIGQKNHCKFWWYTCEETVLCIWTLIMYIDYMTNVTKPWCEIFPTLSCFSEFFSKPSSSVNHKRFCEQVEKCNYHPATCHFGDLLYFCAATVDFSQLPNSDESKHL